MILASADALRAEKEIRALAHDQTGSDVWWPTQDVAVTITYRPRQDVCTIEVIPMAERRKGFSGRRRDIANLAEVILDALQGSVYTNDNQVARLQIIRDLDDGQTERS
jgi:Holliday junction resolvase RusA-like endonuclease